MRQLKITKSITNRDSGIDLYLVEIGRYDLISTSREEELGMVILSPNTSDKEKQKAVDEFAKANLRFVVSVAKQYQNQGLSLADLIAEGNLGLIKAAWRFDTTKGFKFISYAVWWIRQNIQAAINENGRIVRLPLNQSGLLQKLNKAKIKLVHVFGRDANYEELAIELGISEERVKETEKLTAKKHTSLDQNVGEDSDISLGSLIEADSDRADPSMHNESLAKDLDVAMSSLSERERLVIRMSYGINSSEPLSLEDIGDRLNLTRERIRQLHAKALKKMANSTQRRVLQTYL